LAKSLVKKSVRGSRLIVRDEAARLLNDVGVAATAIAVVAECSWLFASSEEWLYLIGVKCRARSNFWAVSSLGRPI
jgi:hypothetical protein